MPISGFTASVLRAAASPSTPAASIAGLATPEAAFVRGLAGVADRAVADDARLRWPVEAVVPLRVADLVLIVRPRCRAARGAGSYRGDADERPVNRRRGVSADDET